MVVARNGSSFTHASVLNHVSMTLMKAKSNNKKVPVTQSKMLSIATAITYCGNLNLKNTKTENASAIENKSV